MWTGCGSLRLAHDCEQHGCCCRRYDLYMDQRQFAEIDGPLLAWEFVLRDKDGGEPSFSKRMDCSAGLLLSRSSQCLCWDRVKACHCADLLRSMLLAPHPVAIHQF